VSNKKSGEEKPNPLEEELKQLKTRVAQLEKAAADKDKELANMFAIGDGAGVSRGLIQASACGVVTAREILKRSPP